MDRAIEVVNNKITEMDTIIKSLGNSHIAENFMMRKYILKDVLNELVSESKKIKRD